MNALDHRELPDTGLASVCGGDIEITEDELKQVTGVTPKMPGMNKTPDVTLKRG